ncbi:MAG: hypothetical protein LBM96_07070, partial [Methanobrevibacter sp.]|nr:hypothetical protein [Candidatus Methanoflexus mossambicus]
MNENKNSLVRIIGLVLVMAVIATAIGAVSAASDTSTIKNAVDGAENNSKIILKNGTYNGSNNTNITISKNLTIVGESAGKVIIDGSNVAKMFTVTKGNTLTLINITFMNGFGVNGGAIYNDGTLNIQNCIFINNIATSNGGAIYTNNGELNIYETMFINNDALNGGALFVQDSRGVVNYNDFENNSDYDLYYNGSFENFIADYNYWGKNIPTITGILLNNYFVVQIIEKVDETYDDTYVSDDVNTDVFSNDDTLVNNVTIDNKIIRLNTNEDFGIVKLSKIVKIHTVIFDEIITVNNNGLDSTAILDSNNNYNNNNDKSTDGSTVDDVQGQSENITFTFNNETYVATVTNHSNGQVTVEIYDSEDKIAIFLNDLIGANGVSDVLYTEITRFNTQIRIAIVSSNKNKIMVTFDDYLVDFEEIAIYINGQLFGNSVVNNSGIEFEYNIDIINDISDYNNYNNNENNNQNTLETDDPVEIDDSLEEQNTLETDDLPENNDLVENDESGLGQNGEEIVVEDVVRRSVGGMSRLAAIAPLAVTDAVSVITVAAVVGASTYYVSPTGNDNNAGTSTGAPLKTIDVALANIAAGGTIYLMTGTHTQGFTGIGIRINKNVNIIGVSGATVILNAGKAGRHFTIDGAYTVKFQNIRLTNGIIPESTGSNVAGSIYIRNTSAKVNIINCTFTTNKATSGGAIYIYTGNVNISNCTFTNNNATYGGAIYITDVAKVNITKVIFTNNIAFSNSSSQALGGAIYISNGTVNISNVTFTKNTALANSGTEASFGGAIMIFDGKVNISKVIFTNNIASSTTHQGAGGAIYIYEDSAKVNITNSTFTNNNASDYYGGAIFISNASVNISKVIFTNNNASGGGAIYIRHSIAKVNITTSTFTKNTADYGGAIAISDGGSVRITYSRIFNNSGVQVYCGGGTATANYNWWGNNTPVSGRDYTSSVIISNYFRANATFNGKTINYRFYLNSSQNTNGSSLPTFNMTIKSGASTLLNKDARVAQSYSSNIADKTAYTVTVDGYSVTLQRYNTIYVSPTGNDNNTGNTTTTPLKTIAAAFDKLNAGGTIYLMAGTHTAGFTVGGVTISKNVNIIGYSGTVNLNANGLGRHFTITGPYTVKFQNIRLINGMVPQSTVAGSI